MATIFAIGVSAIITPVQSTTAAAQALEAAANAVPTAIASRDIKTHYTRLVSVAAITSSDAEADESAVLLEGSTSLRQAPGSNVWIRVSTPLRPVKAWGPHADKTFKEALRLTATDGFVRERSDTSSRFWEHPFSIEPKRLAELPRSPLALSRVLGGVTNADSALQPDAEKAIDAASNVLGSGLADAALQAATYRALELIPGLTLRPDAKDLDGRTGIAIGVLVSNGLQRIDVILDPDDGRYLGRIETNIKAINGAPAGTVYESSAVHVN